MASIVVVGSCNTDLISYVPRLARPGETIHGDSFRTGYGGKGANQCIMAARLGADVAMVAKVGDDLFGRGTVKNFEEHKVNIDHIHVTTEAATGAATILVDQSGQNAIVIVSGANLLLTEAEIAAAEEVIAGAKVMVCQLEVEPEVTLCALQLGKKHGVRTVFNVAPGCVGLGQEFFEATDILCLNESEDCTAVQCGTVGKRTVGSKITSKAEMVLEAAPISDLPAARKAVSELQQKGCGAVVLTLGQNGVVFCESSDSPIEHVPAEQVLAVDTTGAGDAFVGAMSYFLASNLKLSFHEVIKRSCYIASQSVLGRGTQTSFPQKADLPPHFFQ